MSEHRKKAVVVGVGIALVLTGCYKSWTNFGRDENNYNPNKPETAMNTGSGLPLETKTPEVSPTPIIMQTPAISPIQPLTSSHQQNLVVNKSKPNEGAVLDTSGKSWYVIRNSKHETPSINQNIKKMIDMYNGVYVINPDVKKIYLTFDEGYENGYTPSILDTLKSKNVKATFFITGAYLKGQKSLIRRMIDDGHGVENHTMNHPSLTSLDGKKFEDEVVGLQNAYKKEFGLDMKYLRPPKGEYNEKVLYTLNSLGYKTAFWSFGYDDYDTQKQKGAEYSHKMIMDNLHNGEIMLLHAVSKDNAEILGRVIDEIREKGYEIGKLD